MDDKVTGKQIASGFQSQYFHQRWLPDRFVVLQKHFGVLGGTARFSVAPELAENFQSKTTELNRTDKVD